MHAPYHFVGPADVREIAMASSPPGTPIYSSADLVEWLDGQTANAESDGSLIATFTISIEGVLSIAPQRSEHVACASGGPVMSAGEITFSRDLEILALTNQSTGFCPQIESWRAVAAALDQIGLDRPGGFTTELVFRFCTTCGERNIVKDSWFVCDLCGADLPTLLE